MKVEVAVGRKMGWPGRVKRGRFQIVGGGQGTETKYV